MYLPQLILRGKLVFLEHLTIPLILDLVNIYV